MASSCVRERSRGLDVLGFQVPEVLSREGTEPGWPTWWVSAVAEAVSTECSAGSAGL